MTAERTLTAALDLAAASAAVRTAADLDRAVWPGLATLVAAGSLAATGFDGRPLAWPPSGVPEARFRAVLVLRRRGGEACVALHRGEGDFTARDVALLHLVRPHLADALWRAAHGAPTRTLTAREHAVVARVARGATDAAIAHELGISRRTVGKHLENAYAALGVHDRTSAALRLAVPPA
ncbi:regulatory LuxR family protein [Actinomycetospora succinea]|uniref:Regulatory LuxR family protein n=1 Tax=Actinomycetospora succinea TaxID=663603 RepID=A0A4R6VNH3_9PSEU|nr:helix-turn-helix transcriptional regulator [Actinomycetospora succinea]TDQ65553.1 regulatory LuxR family protein [Actinomycetospora succinea]